MSNLSTYKLFIHPGDYHLLKKDIWSDDPIPAQLNTGKKSFNVDIVYRGSHIRKVEKKSYDILFNKKPSPNTSNVIHLNAEYYDMSLLRNKLSLDFFSSLGVLSPKSRYVVLMINGVQKGVYLHIESVDDTFLRKRGLPDGAIYYAVDDDANFSLYSSLDESVKDNLISGYERELGTDEDDGRLSELVVKINTLSKSEFPSEIRKYVAVESYLKWLAGVVCTQNFDGFVHNYALYENPVTGLYEIIPWDYDATWGRDIHGDMMEEDYIPLKGYNTLTARLLDHDEYKTMYKDILTQTINHQFTADYLKPIIMKNHETIRPHVLKDPYMKDKIDQFDGEPEVILEYIAKRRGYIKQHIEGI